MLMIELGWLIAFRLLSALERLDSSFCFFFPLLSTLVSFDLGADRADFVLVSFDPSAVLVFDYGLFSRLFF